MGALDLLALLIRANFSWIYNHLRDIIFRCRGKIKFPIIFPSRAKSAYFPSLISASPIVEGLTTDPIGSKRIAH